MGLGPPYFVPPWKNPLGNSAKSTFETEIADELHEHEVVQLKGAL